MNLKVINNKQISNKGRLINSYKVKFDNENLTNKLNDDQIDQVEIDSDINKEENQTHSVFKEGDKVKHIEEPLTGKVAFVGDENISIIWDDNTRERMKINEANKYLKHNVSNSVEKAIDIVGDVKIEDENNNELDIEKIKLQRKVNKLENELILNKSESVKNKVAKELLDIAITKGIIEEDELELEMQKLLLMDDDEYENYKNYILEFDNEHQVFSMEEESEELSEAEIALKKIKGNGGRGFIGDFSDTTTTSNSSLIESSNSGKRSLSDIKDEKITFNNQYNIPDFEDQFIDILSNKKMEKVSSEKTSYEKVSLPGFENLQGLTKPLQINSKHVNSSFPTNTSLKDLMGSLSWTTLSKQ